MTILSDHPILRDADARVGREPDSFTLQSRLGSVFDIIRHKNTRLPIAAAVYGDWGTGKSSAMRWLAEQLETWSKQSPKERGGHPKVRTVWFDPWKYHDRVEVWRGLVAEVILRTISVEGASLATVTNAARKFGMFLGRSFLTALSAIKLKVTAEAKPLGSGVGGEAEIDLKALQEIAADWERTAHPEKAFLNEFETALKQWVEESLGPDERMVVFIDDLDRCLPQVTLEVLEALKLYLDIPNLVFVVGLDRTVVYSVVRKHYIDSGLGEKKAAQYLDKMFQVEVDIPPSQTQIQTYLPLQIQALDKVSAGYWSKQLGEGDGNYRTIIESTIRELAEHNPREIKRLINSTLLRGSAAERDETLGESGNLRFAQGCQVYLIQKVLTKYVPRSDGLMREQRTWELFTEWSELLRKYPDYNPRRGLEVDDAKVEVATSQMLGKLPSAHAELVVTFEELRDKQPRDPENPKEFLPFLDQELLWDLLRIPFSADIAAATAIRRADKPETAGSAETPVAPPPPAPTTRPMAGAPQPAIDVRKMPSFLLSRIAKELNLAVDSVTPQMLASVRSLDLSGSSLDDDSMWWIANLTALQRLDLGGTQVTDAGLAHLANLTALQTLSLGGAKVTDDGLPHLANLTVLQTLGLGGTRVTDAGLAHLAKLTALQTLGLSGTQVTDAGVPDLANLTALQTLHLSETRVTDAGLGHLANLTALKRLFLSGTQVTDAGLAHLAHLTALQALYLQGTQVTDAGIERLKKESRPSLTVVGPG
jgi:hypothetical protein